ncbi:retention module-containing protein [Halomonas sp. E14]|uniref:retention module-containing protein n=1 Tax=Halomonas sp. E14 TaxID=3397245 RepID=UPI00403E675E
MAIATVISITGQAWARDAQGNLRELRIGDTLQEGDVLVTSEGGNAQLDFDDGLAPTLVEAGEQVSLPSELGTESDLDASDFAALDDDLEALLAALDDDTIDLLDILDATAAGAGGGGGADGGHSFVRLARVAEETDPLAFDYGLNDLGGAPEEEGGFFTLTEDEVPEEPVIPVVIAPTAESLQISLSDALVGNSGAIVSGTLNFSFGNGENGSISFANMDGVESQVGQETILYVWDASTNTLTAFSPARELELFTIQVNPATGAFTLTQLNNLLHAAGTDEALASLVYTVTSSSGTVTGAFSISILDDAPIAADDVASIAAGEFLIETGTLLNNDQQGADGARVTQVAVGENAPVAVPESGMVQVNGQYGVLTIAADGTYSYARNAGTPGGVSDSFTYTLTDADGDSDTATLTIAIGNAPVAIDNPVGADGFHVVVNEAWLPNGTATGGGELTQSGSFTISAPDGVQTLTVGGAFIVQNGVVAGTLPTLTTAGGNTLQITGYNAATGVVSYSYTLNNAKAHDAGEDDLEQSFAIFVQDLDGSEATSALTVQILDDAPIAADDSNSLAAGEFTLEEEGNLLANDQQGADGARVTQVAVGENAPVAVPESGMVQVNGQYGVLTIAADGTYSYARNAGTPGGVSDSFTYTLTDADGDSDTATLTIAIGNAPVAIDNPVGADGFHVVVNEAWLPNGTATGGGELTQSGSFTISAPDGVQTLTVGGAFIVQNGVVAGTLPTLTTAGGNTLQITGYNAATGVVSYSYTLNNAKAHDAGEDDLEQSFAIFVQDLDGSEATSALTVQILDDAPVAVADTLETPVTSGDTATGNVKSNDKLGADSRAEDGAVVGVALGDSDGEPVSGGVGTAIEGTYGTLTLNANGSFTYVAKPNITGTDVFTYTIEDADGSQSTTTLTVDVVDGTVEPVNTNAEVFEAGLSEGTAPGDSKTATGSLTLAEGWSAVAASGTTANGTYVINADGTFRYTLSTSADHSEGDVTDVIEYTTTDALGNTQTNTLTVTIVDDAPVAVADTLETPVTSGDTATGNVKSNDKLGADSRAEDGAVVGVALGDSDGEPVSGGVGTAIEGTYGTLTLNANGSFTYVAKPNITGTDVFTYTIEDADGSQSTTTLTVDVVDGTVEPVNTNAEVFEAGLSEGTAPGDSKTATGSLTLAEGWSAVAASGTTANGTYVINADGTFRYTLSTSADHSEGDVTDVIEYTTTDALGNTQTNTLTVTIVDDAPVAVADTLETPVTSGDTATGNVKSNDKLGADSRAEDGAVVGVALGDSDGEPVSGGVGTAIEGTYGTLTLNANGSFTYVAKPNITGTDVFTYTIEDADGSQSTTTLTVGVVDGTVEPVNTNAEVFEAGLSEGTAPGDSKTATGSLTLAEGWSAVAASGTTANGTYVINADGTFRYTLSTSADHSEGDVTDVIEYTTTDALGNTQTNTLTVTIVDDAPVAVADTLETPVTSGDTATGNVKSNDKLGADSRAEDGAVVGVALGDSDGEPVSGGVGTAIEGTYGTLTLNANGSFTYVAKPNITGTDVFTYTIEDADGSQSTTTLTVDVVDGTVEPVNTNAEVFEAGLSEGTAPGDSKTATGSLTLAEGWSAVAASGTTANGTYVINADGTFRYTLSTSADHSEGDVTDVIEYTTTDALGNTQTNTLTVTIVDDAPVAVADTLETPVTSGDTATGNVKSNDKLGADSRAEDGAVVGVALGDSDGEPVSGGVGTAIEGTYGTLTLNANGSFTYVAKPNITGTDVFTYTIEDADGSQSTTTLTVDVVDGTVEPVNTNAEVFEAGLSEGTAPGDSKTATGSLTLAEGWSAVAASGTTANGTYVINADGTFRYTLSTSADHSEGDVTDVIEYTTTDALGNTQTNTLTVTIVDDAPVLNVTNAVALNAIGVIFSGTLAEIGADFAGKVTLSGTPPAGLTSGGNAVTYQVSSEGSVLTAKAGGQVVFTLTAHPEGTYTYEQFLPLDLAILSSDLQGSSKGSGPQPAYYIYEDGTFDANATAKAWSVKITGSGNVNPSTVGMGIGNNLFETGEKMRLDFDNEGASGAANLAYVAKIGINGLEGSETVHYVAKLTDGTQIPGKAEASSLVDGSLFITAPSGTFIDYVDLTAGANTSVRITSISTFTLDQGMPKNLGFGFTATDADGDSVSGSLNVTVQNSSLLIGNADDNVIAGGAGSQTLWGGAGNDILIGGAGNDTLIGGEGDDVFQWNLGDQGTSDTPAIDTVKDFSLGNNVLDLADLLQNESIETLDQYIFAAQEGADTVLYINHGGNIGVNGDNATQVIVLENYVIEEAVDSSAILAELLASNQLNIDP